MCGRVFTSPHDGWPQRTVLKAGPARIPEGMNIEQALQQFVKTRGALQGDILCFSYDGYTCTQDIVTDIYAT